MNIGKKIISILLCVILMCSGMTIASFAADEMVSGNFTYTVSSGKVTIVGYPETGKGSVTIPSTIDGKTVVAIDDGAFQACTLITEVIIPDTVTSIGKYAFAYCVTLETVTIPSSVTSIGKNAFQNSKKVVIECESGSYAETYANENGITTSEGGSSSDDTETVVTGTYKDYIISVIEDGSKSWISDVVVDGETYHLSLSLTLSVAEAEAYKGKKVNLTIKKGEVIKIGLYKAFSYSDTWNFANSARSFSDDPEGEGYYIPAERYKEVFGSAYVDNVKITTGWGGNCFGMSATAVLFNMGKLDWSSYDRLYENDFSTVNNYWKYTAYKSPSDTLKRYYFTSSGYATPVTKLIEQYQILQDSTNNYKCGDNTTFDDLEQNYYKLEESIINSEKELSFYSHNESGNYISNILKTIQNSDVAFVISLIFNGGGHAIVIRTDKKPEKQSNGWWKVYVYDPNSPFMPDSLTSGDFKDKGLLSCYMNGKEDRYIELNPSTNQFRYKGMLNSDGSCDEYWGCDSDGDTLYLEQIGEDSYCVAPEFMYLIDVSSMPTTFNGKEPWLSSDGESSIKLDGNQSFKVYNKIGKLLAVVDGQNYCTFSDEAEIRYNTSISSDGSVMTGTLMLYTDQYEIKSEYGTITNIGENGVCSIESSEAMTCSFDLKNNSMNILAEEDGIISARVANIKDSDTYSTAYVDGKIADNEDVELSVNGDILSVTTSKTESDLVVSCKSEESEKEVLGKINDVSTADIKKSKSVKLVSLGNMTMNYKDSKTLSPIITADDGAEYTITYSSDSKNVTVDENGKIYGAKKGTANITVTVTDSNGNTVSDTCKVTVEYSFWQWIIKIVLFGWIWY